MLIGGDRVEMNSALESKHQESQSWREDTAFGFGVLVAILAGPENWKGQAECNSRNQERKVESDVTLSIRHGDLSYQSANVDEEVEPVDRRVRGKF
jgi:hypothetical protein